VRDLCTIGSHYYFGRNTLINDDSKREAFKTNWQTDKRKRGYGLGFSTYNFNGSNFVGHGGGFPGFITCTLIEPEQQLVLVVLTNALGSEVLMIAEGMAKVISFFRKHGKEKGAESKKELGKFECSLYSKWGATDYVRVGNKLMALDPNAWDPTCETTELVRKGKNTFEINQDSVYASPGERVKFNLNKDGHVTSASFGGFVQYPKDKFLKLIYG
jgi:CubicO group peptidase (beta-lactamase class C family)